MPSQFVNDIVQVFDFHIILFWVRQMTHALLSIVQRSPVFVMRSPVRKHAWSSWHCWRDTSRRHGCNWGYRGRGRKHTLFGKKKIVNSFFLLAANYFIWNIPNDVAVVDGADVVLVVIDDVTLDVTVGADTAVEVIAGTEVAVEVTELAFEVTEVAVEVTALAFEDTEAAVEVTELAFEDTEAAVEVTEVAVEVARLTAVEVTAGTEATAGLVAVVFVFTELVRLIVGTTGTFRTSYNYNNSSINKT